MAASGAWIRNIASGYLDNAVGAIIFVFMTPFIVRHVGTDGYAVWILCHLVGYYLELADLGLGEAQVRFHARYAARGRMAALKDLTSSIVTALAIGGVLAALAGIVLAFSPYVSWLQVPAGIKFDLRAVLVVVALQVLVGVPGRALNNIYEGAERFDLQNTRSIAIQLLTAAAQVMLLTLGHGVLALALVELGALSLTILIDLYLVNRILPGLLTVSARLHRRVWRRIRHFSVWSSIDDLLEAGTSYVDEFLVVALLPFVQLTPYALAGSAAGVLVAATQPITDTFLPAATNLHARRRKDALVNLLLRGTRTVVAIAAPLAIFLCFFGAPLLHVWVPESAAFASAPLTILLTLSALVSVFLWTSSIVLTAVGRIRQLALLLIIEIALDVVLILVLAPRYGLTGIAAAGLISNAGIGLMVEMPLIARVVGIATLELLRATLLRLAVASLPAAALAFWIASRFSVTGWLDLAAAAAVIAIAYLAGLLAIGVSGEERGQLRLWASSLARGRRHWPPGRPEA
jgi:O-antigen/teichoic acid export membrane protein